MGQALIAFDTDHIKRYVFGTDKLKEIRGASSLLDYLNRIVMVRIATKNYQAEKVYANGGSGMFVIEAEQPIELEKKVNQFQKEVQQEYYAVTGGTSSVTSASLLLPDDINDASDNDIANTLALLQWHLQEKKNHPPKVLALVSQPFMRLCDSCGIEYADAAKPPFPEVDDDDDDGTDPDEKDKRYCKSCLLKRERDGKVKKYIKYFIKSPKSGKRTLSSDDYLWEHIIDQLREIGYDIPQRTRRSEDFNVFRNFKGSKDYLALIYADANNMGQAKASRHTLKEQAELASTVDKAIYTAVCTAIARHLKIKDHLKPQDQLTNDLKYPVFPFDILLMGGDDICMVVPASVAMDVALTIAETFHTETQKEHTLSVGVVLAPIKYPFGLLQEMAESTLKFAKKAGADARQQAQKSGTTDNDDTRINFMIVTGGSSSDFKSMHGTVYHKHFENMQQEFYATLRPYAPNDLNVLLKTIRGNDGSNLGRTKLHQIREAVLKMNLTTGVSEGLAVLRNWREKQRNHVVRHVYEFGGRYQMPRSNPDDPGSGFPRVTFPWFADGTNEKGYDIYRTPLLDFVELYDFVSREGGDSIDEA